MNKTNEKPILELVGSCDQLGRATRVAVSGDYAFVVSDNSAELGDPKKPVLCMLYIIDISNPKEPLLTSSFESPGALVGVAAESNYVYLAESSVTKPDKEGFGCSFNEDHGGVRILDISKPHEPHEVGFFHTEGLVRGCSLQKNLVYLVIKDLPSFAHLYIKKNTTIRGRLQAIDISNPEIPFEVGRLDAKQGFRSIFLQENRAYVISDFKKGYFDEYSGVCIYDTSNPKQMKELKTIEHSAEDMGVFVSGDLAYVIQDGTDRDTSCTDWYFVPGGLRIINISNIKKPEDIGHIGQFDLEAVAPVNIIAVDKYAIIVHHSGLELLDVSDPTKPISLGSYKTNGESWDVYYKNGLIFVADDNNLGIYRIAQN